MAAPPRPRSTRRLRPLADRLAAPHALLLLAALAPGCAPPSESQLADATGGTVARVPAELPASMRPGRIVGDVLIDGPKRTPSSEDGVVRQAVGPNGHHILYLDFDGKDPCEVSDAVWRKHTDGTKFKASVRARSGEVVCGDL